jgi:cellulose synthase/poly-beta-1,6-N-acetylglucosamine synthase-like glycosyltransferase
MTLTRHERRFHGSVLPASTDELVVSAIMPVYNEEETLENAVRRVRAVHLNIEIVAVNDASRQPPGT